MWEIHETHVKGKWEARERYIRGMWEIHETHMKGTWEARESYIRDMLKIHETHMKGTWEARERYIRGIWEIQETHVKGTWEARERYIIGMLEIHETHVKGTWKAHERHMRGMWKIHETRVKGTWEVRERYLSPTVQPIRTILASSGQILCSVLVLKREKQLICLFLGPIKQQGPEPWLRILLLSWWENQSHALYSSWPKEQETNKPGTSQTFSWSLSVI